MSRRLLPPALLIGLWAACAAKGPAVHTSAPTSVASQHDLSPRDPVVVTPSSDLAEADPTDRPDPTPMAEELGSLDAGLPDAGEDASVAGEDASVIDAEADASLTDAAGDAAPTGVSPEVLARGRRVYGDVCMLCHDIRNRLPGLGWTPGRMKRRIRRGGRRMPAIPPQELTQGQMRVLFVYLREIGTLRQEP